MDSVVVVVVVSYQQHRHPILIAFISRTPYKNAIFFALSKLHIKFDSVQHCIHVKPDMEVSY